MECHFVTEPLGWLRRAKGSRRRRLKNDSLNSYFLYSKNSVEI